MRTLNRQVLVPILLALSAAACGAGNAAAGSQANASTVTSANPADYRHRNHGGAMRLITVSLAELDLTTDQQAALETMQRDLLAPLEPGRLASSELAEVLADGVASGELDRSRVDPAIAKTAEANVRLHAATIQALDRLHAVLTPKQRAALIDKMQVLWALWRQEAKDRAGEPQAPTDLTILAGRLGLSPAQVERIHTRFTTALQDATVDYYPRDVETRMNAFGAAFKGTSFDADALQAEPDPNADTATWGATRMAKFFEAIAPELDAAQRKQLAQEIRDHARRHDQP